MTTAQSAAEQPKRTFMVAERWPLEMRAVSKTPGEPLWWADWLARSPKEASQHIAASYGAYRSLLDVYSPDDIQTASESFGGVGAQGVIIQNLFHPYWHIVQDYSADSALHLQNLFARSPGVLARQADSYVDEPFTPVDLVGLDFGDLTCWRTREGEKHRGLLDRVFQSGPKAVVLTDIAGPRLHLQRDRYETLLGVGSCRSQEAYLTAFLGRLEVLYDYRLVAGFYHRWSAVMALVPVAALEAASLPSTMRGLFPTPDRPCGLLEI